MTPDAQCAAVLSALTATYDVIENERFISCVVRGSPHEASPAAWRPRPWRPPAKLHTSLKTNGYLTASTFRRAADGSWRRRNDLFVRAWAIMVDDVGPRMPRLGVAPSVRIETSPGNEQWLYLLQQPIADRFAVEAVISAIIDEFAPGTRDPGMAGVNRVFRLPGFANLKPEHDGWICRLNHCDATRRWTLDALTRELHITPRTAFRTRPKPTLEQGRAATEQYNAIVSWLIGHGMAARHVNAMGWLTVRCPWEEEHSKRATTGASIRWPCAENDFQGAFRCHHGSCAERGWFEFTQWIDEMMEEEFG